MRRWLLSLGLLFLPLMACGDTDSRGADAGPLDDCERCAEDELCVVECGGFGEVYASRCVTTSCSGADCTSECEEELCGDNFSCQYGCNNAPRDVFQCAGP